MHASFFGRYGTSKEDMLAQCATTLMDAQRGAFLAKDFRFGPTDNKVTESFANTLTAVSPGLAGSSSRP